MIFKDNKEYCDKSWLLIADHIVLLDYGQNSWSGYCVAINEVFLHCQVEEMRTKIASGWGLEASNPQLLEFPLQS